VRVLVADDDPLARRLLEVTLTRSGYEVLAVADGVKAWDVLCGQDSPTLALLDWMMPGLTGVDVCRKVREAAPSGPIYLILVTSKGRTEDVVSALRTGADDYITKPFEIEELRARLAVGERLVTLQQQLAERVRAEVLGSREMIQGACGAAPRAFAYPNGRPADYTSAVVEVVREAGFSCAVTTRFGLNTEQTSPWELRRGQPWEEHLPTFALKLAWYRMTLR